MIATIYSIVGIHDIYLSKHPKIKQKYDEADLKNRELPKKQYSVLNNEVFEIIF